MYHHPNTILALHHERQGRLEVEAARDALMRTLRRRRGAAPFRRRGRPRSSRPVPARLKPLLR